MYFIKAYFYITLCSLLYALMFYVKHFELPCLKLLNKEACLAKIWFNNVLLCVYFILWLYFLSKYTLL